MENKDILFENSRLMVRKVPGRPFTYFERLGVDSIAFLIFERQADGLIKLGVIKELKPSLIERFNKDVFIPTAFGGSQDKISREEYLRLSDDQRLDFMKNLAMTECKEESGFEINDLDRCYFTGIDFLSSQMNQLVYNFAFDITGLENTGTIPFNKYEAMSEVLWFYPEDFIRNVQCAKAKSIYVNLMRILTDRLMEMESSKKAARVPFDPPLQVNKLLTENKKVLINIPNDIPKEKRPQAREFYKELASFLNNLGYIVSVNDSDSEADFDLLISEVEEVPVIFNKKYIINNDYLLNDQVKSDIINLDLD